MIFCASGFFFRVGPGFSWGRMRIRILVECPIYLNFCCLFPIAFPIGINVLHEGYNYQRVREKGYNGVASVLSQRLRCQLGRKKFNSIYLPSYSLVSLISSVFTYQPISCQYCAILAFSQPSVAGPTVPPVVNSSCKEYII